MRNQTCHSKSGDSRFFGGNEEMGTLEDSARASGAGKSDIKDNVNGDLEIIGINRKSVFTIEEARRVFPIVFRLTKSYSERVQILVQKLELHTENTRTPDKAQAEVIEAEAGRLIQEWQTKMQKLGGLPNGQWVVDFDSGDGYFCWKYPERELVFWHHYRDGFTKRIKISALSAPQSVVHLTPVENVIDL
jgi:hypothetical protein